MYGAPEKKKGRCNATIAFGDDCGDNSCTFRCGLLKGHKGLHQEKEDMGYGKNTQPYTLEWEDCHEKHS